MDHRVVVVIDRPGEFAADQIVRQIRGQPQIGKAVEQLQREEQIGGHAVAMGFDMHRDAGLFGQGGASPRAAECSRRAATGARPAAG